MKIRIALPVTLTLTGLLLTACPYSNAGGVGGGGGGGGGGTGGSPVPNSVSGTVLTEQGQPVPGATMIVEPAMYRGTFFGTTDESGRYRFTDLNAATNPYYVYAYKEVDYHGRQYCVRMAGNPNPYQDPFNSKAGAIRNYVWKISGPSDMPTSDNGTQSWGGTLRFENFMSMPEESTVDPDATIRVTLVPDGPLIDGSTGTTLVKTLTMKEGLTDIPVGAYRVSAELASGDNFIPLRVNRRGIDAETSTAEATIMFDGFDTCGHSGTFRETPVWLVK